MVLVFFVGFEGGKVNWVVAKNNSLPNFYIVIMSIAKNPVINFNNHNPLPCRGRVRVGVRVAVEC